MVGDLGPPPPWWNLPALKISTALAVETVERHEQGSAVPIAGRDLSQGACVWVMRANVLAAFPRRKTYTLTERIVPSAEDLRAAARCFRRAADIDTSGFETDMYMTHSRNLLKAAADPNLATMREASIHFAQNPESDAVHIDVPEEEAPVAGFEAHDEAEDVD